jgi:hypothetical protein
MFYLIILISVIVFIAIKIYNAQEEKLQNEANSNRREEKAKQYFEKWTKRYGNEEAQHMVAGKVWIGMSLEQLLAVKGQPNLKREEHLKTIYEFGGIVNGVIVTVEDSKVVHLVDR